MKMPEAEQILADIDDFLARRAAGERPLSADDAFGAILSDLRRRGPDSEGPQGALRSGAIED